MRKAIARAGHEILKHVIRIERKRLVAVGENATPGEVFTVKSDCDKTPCHCLGRLRERLLALALAEI